MEWRLMEKVPARAFEDAYLLGNGALGMSVYGGIATERLLLNADTLWSGQETEVRKPDFYGSFKRAQSLALQDRFKEANQIIDDEMEGVWGEAYLPMANVWITLGQKDNRRNMPLRKALLRDEESVTGYERVLALREAIAGVRYEADGVAYERQAFVSHPAKAAVVRLTAEGGKLQFSLALDSPLKHSLCEGEDCALILKGIAPDHAEPSYTTVKPSLVYNEEERSSALRFGVYLKVAETDGKVSCDGTRIYVTDAGYADILVTGDTNYAGFCAAREASHEIIIKRLKQRVLAAQRRGYAALRREHIEDVTALFDRFEISLGEEITGKLPTGERLKRNAQWVDDPSVCALVLQYARYLTIAASREGTQAMNLQGIWNPMTDAPWACNYTTNINLEMNYWPCEALGLGELHEPLLRLIGEISESGKETAREFYHMGGWTAHHNVDLWRLTAPSCEDASWSWWPFAGAWLCAHLITHYQYSQDREFLERAYPVLRGCAEFLLDFLVEDEEGRLMTAPSVSPENKHIVAGEGSFAGMVQEIGPGKRFSSALPSITAVTKSSTMDMTLIREAFGNLLWAARELGKEEPLAGKLEDALRRLPPYRVGRYGQLLEWFYDDEECTPGMGHMSHLYGVYPAEIITEETPALFAAAGRSLLRRKAHGGLKGGWPGAWAICLGARLGCRELCAQTVRTMGEGLGANLLAKECVQIDGVLGWAAGITELLLQSHGGVIRLLPAIPDSWREGSFRGMRARGGFTVDLAWKDGKPRDGRIRAVRDRECRICQEALKEVRDSQNRAVAAAESGTVRFLCRAGEDYRLAFD